MKPLILIIAFVLCLTSKGEAFDKWTATDTVLQVATIGLLTADWLQTRCIAKNPHKLREYNPILGRHPAVSDVDIYFAASAALHTGIAYILPKPYRNYWQAVWIGIEIGAVINNVTVGIRMDI